ncbi:MAG: AEC family transporter [Pelodictyon phaeoclathratiforme]
MFDLAFLLAPVFATFFLGMFLRKTSVFDDYAADVLFKLVYHLTLPALLLSVLSWVVISSAMLFLPLLSSLLILLTLAAVLLTGKAIKMQQQSWLVVAGGSMIMNVGFVMPFIQSFYGDDGLARLFIFDLPNGLLASAVVCTFGNSDGGATNNGLLKKLITSPPLLALMAALLMNALDLRPMPIATSVLHSIGKLTIPLMLLALGASFRITKVNPFHLAVAIALRMVLGLALGVWLASLFGLEGLDRAIVVLSASAPAGFSTISLASIEELDHEFAATLVASSMIVAMILIPVLLTIL